MQENEVILDDLQSELDSYDDEIEEDDDLEEKPRKAGRRKGSRNKKTIENNAKADPFEFAIQYTVERCEPVLIRIFRSGAFLADINFSADASKIKYRTISDIQRHLGPGYYTFRLISLTTKEQIAEIPMQILELPNELADTSIPKSDSSDSLENVFSQLANMPQTGNPTQAQPPIFQPQITLPKQKTVAESLKEWMPLITIMIPLVKDLVGKRESLESERIKMERELRKEADDRLERERTRMREDEMRLKLQVKELVEEKSETLGLQPEKSTIGEIAEIVKGLGGIVTKRAEVQKAIHKAAPKVQPVKKAAPKPTAKPDVVVQPSTPTDYNDDMILDEILGLLNSGVQESTEIVNYIKGKPDLLASLKKYSSETISQKARSKLQLEGELGEMIDQYIKEVYDNL